MVADGMSMGTLTCADYFSRRLRGRGLTWLQLQANPKVYSGLMNMRSLNSIVTDSSAASSSWGCGARIINGTVNQRGNGDNLTTPLPAVRAGFMEARPRHHHRNHARHSGRLRDQRREPRSRR
jgi:alkaline phosphatase